MARRRSAAAAGSPAAQAEPSEGGPYDSDVRSGIEVAGSAERDENLVLPPGAHLRIVTLAEPFVVMLPQPTTAFFWFGADFRTFQGPVALP